MTEDVLAKLRKKENDDKFHEKLLTHVMRLVNMSRKEMSKHYDDWDLQDSVYRGEMIPDLDDRKQEQRRRPTKMIVPNTFAQVMSFSSFLFLMFNQNANFYTLGATGEEDHGRKQMDCELLLQRDIRHNEFNTKLFQHLLDIGRFGPAILETCWTHQKTRAMVQTQTEPLIVNGVAVPQPPTSSWREFSKFEGNLIRNVSPYRFFPDTRHPLVDFQKGEFCAAEEEYSMHQLRDLEASGEVAGVDHIEPLRGDYEKIRGLEPRTSRWSLNTGNEPWKKFDPDVESSVALVTKVQIWIVPSKFILDDDKPLGPEEFPILYHVWYANDNRLIRVEPAYWWHNEFGWSVAQFTPDMHQTLTYGLADLVYRLQDVISWYVNSHITSVRRIIANRLIVDPKIIDTKTLDGEGDIYLRKGVNIPLERAVGQLRVTDATSGHMADAELLNRIMQMVTGVNDNMSGQYNSGRRSAQESRVVTAGAAGRMKMHGGLIWETSLNRMGRHMLSNLRQSLSAPSFVRAVGMGVGIPATGLTPEQDLENRFLAFKGTPEEVICGGDYFAFDSTLASERGFIAQSLQELLIAVMSNPNAAMQWDLSPKAMIEEIQHLRGAGPIGRFSLSKRVAAGLEPAPMPVPVPQPSAA